MLPMTILGFVLGCLSICLEVPDRGLGGQYTAAPTVNGDSGWMNNWSYDKWTAILFKYHVETVERPVLQST